MAPWRAYAPSSVRASALDDEQQWRFSAITRRTIPVWCSYGRPGWDASRAGRPIGRRSSTRPTSVELVEDVLLTFVAERGAGGLGVREVQVELVCPNDDTTGVARFLEARGEGFHHVCFEVQNLAETLLRLEIDGLELIDSAPRRGAEGPVAFIHPRSCHGVLVELIEAPGGPAWASLGF